MKEIHKQALHSVANALTINDYLDYLESLVQEMVDIRNLPENSSGEDMKARAIAAKYIEEKLISPLKIHSGKVEESYPEYE